MSFRLRDRDEGDWGLRLRVPVGFTVAEVEDDPLAAFDDIRAFSVVPTAELEVPLDEDWTLVPFLGLGVARDFVSDETSWLGNSGVKLLADVPLDPANLVLASALRHGFDVGSDGDGFEDFGRVELGLDLSQRTRASVRGHHPTPGVYARAFFYWDGVVFERSTRTIEIDEEYELGLSLGTDPDFEILGFGLPRTYLGYRFGDGLTGVRISFGEIL